MTPEAVVFRCLQLGTSAEFEAGLFAELVAADADLAAHWFGLLGLPADASALQGYLEKLDPTDRDQLVQAQENRLTQYSSSVRLGMQQWLAALEAALWGSILWRMMASEHDHRFDTETRFLLALSGVQGVDDEDVQSLERFRSARVELLEDAPLAHRIFAVIDRVSQGQADHVAEQLLLLPGEEIAQSKVLASQELDDKVHRLGLGTQVEADWAHSIWLRRQINSVSAALRDTDDREALLRTHMTLSKTVFSISPLLLLVNHGAACLYSPLAPDLSIRTASQSSYIARALRTNSSVELIDSVELPVADRQALAQLEQDEARAVPVIDSDQTAQGVMLFPEEDTGLDADTTRLYADMMAQHLGRVNGKNRDVVTDSQDDDPTERFRQGEIARLRELVHEANNPLSIVHNYLHILELRLGHDEEASKQLKLINSELARAGDIFSRARLVSEIEPEPIDTEHTSEVVDLDINGWATDLLELHQGLARQGQVSLVGPLFESSSFVRTQPGKLTQVATNLLKNALEATPQGGQVSLMCQTRAYREGRAGVMLAISDTGPGLSESVMATLQAPKQSTKGGDHQGIGLSVAYRLCAEIGVALDVVTSTEPPQQGTTFTLFIPHQAD